MTVTPFHRKKLLAVVICAVCAIVVLSLQSEGRKARTSNKKAQPAATPDPIEVSPVPATAASPSPSPSDFKLIAFETWPAALWAAVITALVSIVMNVFAGAWAIYKYFDSK